MQSAEAIKSNEAGLEDDEENIFSGNEKYNLVEPTLPPSTINTEDYEKEIEAKFGEGWKLKIGLSKVGGYNEKTGKIFFGENENDDVFEQVKKTGDQELAKEFLQQQHELLTTGKAFGQIINKEKNEREIISYILVGNELYSFAVSKANTDEKYEYSSLEEVVQAKARTGAGWSVRQTLQKAFKLSAHPKEGKGAGKETESIWDELRTQGWAERLEENLLTGKITQKIYFADAKANVSYQVREFNKKSEPVHFDYDDSLDPYDDNDEKLRQGKFIPNQNITINLDAAFGSLKKVQQHKNAKIGFWESLLKTRNPAQEKPVTTEQNILKIFGFDDNKQADAQLKNEAKFGLLDIFTRGFRPQLATETGIVLNTGSDVPSGSTEKKFSNELPNKLLASLAAESTTGQVGLSKGNSFDSDFIPLELGGVKALEENNQPKAISLETLSGISLMSIKNEYSDKKNSYISKYAQASTKRDRVSIKPSNLPGTYSQRYSLKNDYARFEQAHKQSVYSLQPKTNQKKSPAIKQARPIITIKEVPGSAAGEGLDPVNPSDPSPLAGGLLIAPEKTAVSITLELKTLDKNNLQNTEKTPLPFNPDSGNPPTLKNIGLKPVNNIPPFKQKAVIVTKKDPVSNIIRLDAKTLTTNEQIERTTGILLVEGVKDKAEGKIDVREQLDEQIEEQRVKEIKTQAPKLNPLIKMQEGRPIKIDKQDAKPLPREIKQPVSKEPLITEQSVIKTRPVTRRPALDKTPATVILRALENLKIQRVAAPDLALNTGLAKEPVFVSASRRSQPIRPQIGKIPRPKVTSIISNERFKKQQAAQATQGSPNYNDDLELILNNSSGIRLAA